MSVHSRHFLCIELKGGFLSLVVLLPLLLLYMDPGRKIEQWSLQRFQLSCPHYPFRTVDFRGKDIQVLYLGTIVTVNTFLIHYFTKVRRNLYDLFFYPL